MQFLGSFFFSFPSLEGSDSPLVFCILSGTLRHEFRVPTRHTFEKVCFALYRVPSNFRLQRAGWIFFKTIQSFRLFFSIWSIYPQERVAFSVFTFFFGHPTHSASRQAVKMQYRRVPKKCYNFGTVWPILKIQKAKLVKNIIFCWFVTLSDSNCEWDNKINATKSPTKQVCWH